MSTEDIQWSTSEQCGTALQAARTPAKRPRDDTIVIDDSDPDANRVINPDPKRRRLNDGSEAGQDAGEQPMEVDAAQATQARAVEPATELDKQKKVIIVDNFANLPEEYRKCVIKSGITPQEADKSLEVVLNILHFKTKGDFYTRSQHANKNKKVRRYNTGESRIGRGIVSTQTLEEEAWELLEASPKRKDYKILCQSGKGGFGRVFLVKSLRDKGNVAVKRVPHLTQKQKRKNFQEIRFLRFCDHPNIIRYHRSFLVKDEIWLITEYMQGGTLTQAVNAHRFQEDEISYIARQVLLALDFLHDNQLAHRDLKSANIMLDFSGSVKIIDFGLCSDVSQGEVVHMVGSPFWMPPEMIRREPHGLPADVWSFAICMMEVANGNPPNKKSSIKAMFVAGTQGYPDPLDPMRGQWSDTFKDFLGKCLHMEPNKRSTVKNLLMHPFLKCGASTEHMKGLFKRIFPTQIPTSPTEENWG